MGKFITGQLFDNGLVQENNVGMHVVQDLVLNPLSKQTDLHLYALPTVATIYLSESLTL